MKRSVARGAGTMLALCLVLTAVSCSGGSDTGGTSASSAVSNSSGASAGKSSGSESGGDASTDLSGELTLLVHPTIYGALGGDDLVGEFKEKTGVSVSVVKAGIGEHLTKFMTAQRAGTGTYDLIAFQNIDYMPKVLDGLAPLTSYIDQAPDEWDWSDFIPAIRDYAKIDGTQYGIPVRLGMQMLYYRTDLFKEAGLKPPKTFKEYINAAEALTTDKVSGAVQRGNARELANDWLGLLYSAGGTILDDSMKCAVNGDAGRAATSLLKSLYDDGSLPEDFFATGRDDYISDMQQGRAAMGIFYSPYWSYLVDPDESTVADKMGFALSPVVPPTELGTSRAQTWNLSISAASDNKDAAWAFIQFATTKSKSLNSALNLANGPVRESVYKDPEYKEKFPVADTWLQAAKLAKSDPPIDQLPKIIDILAKYVTSAINGSSSVENALADACGEIDNAMSS